MDIISTIGPTLETTEDIKHAVAAGSCVFRIHLGYDQKHIDLINRIKYVENELNQKLNILLDFPSSRPRVTANTEYAIKNGDVFYFCSDENVNNLVGDIPVSDFDSLIFNASVGQELLFFDARLKATVFCVDVEKKRISLTCTYGEETLKNGNSITFKSDKVSYQLIRKSDKDLLKSLAISNISIDWIAFSFSETAKQIKDAEEQINNLFIYPPKLIAKIETREAIYNLREIAAVVDGMMVARGDLAVHIDSVLFSEVQNKIVSICNEHDLYSIVSTELLENFVSSGVLSRPEMNGLSLAISQKPKALQLCKETVWSDRPIDAIKLIKKFVIYETYRNEIEQIKLPEKIINKKRVNKPFIVAIEGANGSGKSTLTRFLCEYFNIPYRFGVPDFLIKDDIKEKMIVDANWYSSALFFISGAIEQIRACKQHATDEIVILDRSIWSTFFVHGSNSPSKLRSIISVVYAEPEIDVEPDMTLILRCSYDVCRTRIRNKSDKERKLDELVNSDIFYQREDQLYNWLGYQRDNVVSVNVENILPNDLLKLAVDMIKEKSQLG